MDGPSILNFWMKTHGSMPDWQQSRFLGREEIDELTVIDDDAVRNAITQEKGLGYILPLAIELGEKAEQDRWKAENGPIPRSTSGPIYYAPSRSAHPSRRRGH